MSNWKNKNRYKIEYCPYSKKWDVIGYNGWVASGCTLAEAFENFSELLTESEVALIQVFIKKEK